MSELSAIFHLDGVLHLQGDQRLALHTESENAAVARKSFSHLKELFSVSPQLRVERAPRLHGHNCYSLYVGEEEKAIQVLNELGILDDFMRPVLGIQPRIVRRQCCGIAYLRGCFLGGGYVSRPDGPAHLEIAVQHAEMAEDLCALMARYSLQVQVARRKRHFVVYSKSRSDQAGLLALVGAYNAVLRLEGDGVLREIREQVNRRVNSETANLERAVDAAQRQLRDIRTIEESLGLNRLPVSLLQVAELRRRYPEATLAELGGYLDPPLSKSAVYHRFIRIHRMASTLS